MIEKFKKAADEFAEHRQKELEKGDVCVGHWKTNFYLGANWAYDWLIAHGMTVSGSYADKAPTRWRKFKEE